MQVAKGGEACLSLKFLEVPGPRGMEATLLGQLLWGAPGAPSLDPRALACGLQSPSELRGLTGTCLSLDAFIFAGHTSLGCPSTLFRGLVKHA